MPQKALIQQTTLVSINPKNQNAMKTKNRLNEACEAIEREVNEWVDGSRWVINGHSLELHNYQGYLKTVISNEETHEIKHVLYMCDQFNYEILNKHEATYNELNPLTHHQKSFLLPNGMKFIYNPYVSDSNILVVEVHYYYPVSNIYVVDVVPSHWLNNVNYMKSTEASPFLVKYVHQLDMSGNS